MMFLLESRFELKLSVSVRPTDESNDQPNADERQR
jgi:hypothetical protein